MSDKPVEKSVAAAALRVGAFITEDASRIIHTRAGGLGADWDLDTALAFVESADEIVWVRSIFHHDLAVRQGDRWVCFDVPQPRAELLGVGNAPLSADAITAAEPVLGDFIEWLIHSGGYPWIDRLPADIIELYAEAKAKQREHHG